MKLHHMLLILATGWILSGCSKKETLVKSQEVSKPHNSPGPMSSPPPPSDKNTPPAAAPPPASDEVGRTIHAERAY